MTMQVLSATQDSDHFYYKVWLDTTKTQSDGTPNPNYVYNWAWGKDGSAYGITDQTKWQEYCYNDVMNHAQKLLGEINLSSQVSSTTSISGVQVAPPPSNTILLAEAKKNQITILTQNRDSAISSLGFVSTADGTSRPYLTDPHSQLLMDELETAVQSGIEKYPQYWIDAKGEEVEFQNSSQATQLCRDFTTNVYNPMFDKYIKLQQKVMGIGLSNYASVNDAISAVQSIIWDDTTAPAVPMGLSESILTTPISGQVSISWNQNTDADLDHYNIYVNYNIFDSSDSNSSTIVGLVSDMTYNISVSAVDVCGNESAQCIAIKVTVS